MRRNKWIKNYIILYYIIFLSYFVQIHRHLISLLGEIKINYQNPINLLNLFIQTPISEYLYPILLNSSSNK